MTKMKSNRHSFYARIIRRSFSTSLIMAALTTLSACESAKINADAQPASSAKTSSQSDIDMSIDDNSEMFTYLDESELIDAYYDIK